MNKVYPDFWKNYLSTFNKKSKRFVLLSIETTGDSVQSDVILTIGAFSVIDDSIHIGDNFETVLMQYKFFHDNKLPFDFIVDSKLKKMGEPDAMKGFIDYLGNAILVGHNINFSVAMLNAALERLECGSLKNEALDVNIMHQKLIEVTDQDFTLDELLKVYKIPNEIKGSSPDAAYRTALLFLKLKSRLGIK
ncbi:3'-5' exonuclease [Flavobacterium algicola]|uniref:3'-5' exonuclease n=1 Tax=Flavobacterium algicola TaxID=556529 RepID=UPI001EFD6B3E|nr:3'-5' exonuclease [Flavobacterium algicola]MCG9792708.1 3'-5' exonuclease [Flavobacterium algicola]